MLSCMQVTSAVLVAPSTVTHGFNTNQRVVKLVMMSSATVPSKQVTFKVVIMHSEYVP